MSMTFIWVAITTGITLGFGTADHRSWSGLNDVVAILGLCLFLAGAIIRWIAILQLKHEFTVNVVIREDHKLKTDGIYKGVRHPSYSGLLMMCLGLAVAMNSFVSVLLTFMPVLVAILYRIRVEENLLLKEFSADYEKYRERTRKIIPKIF
jgi:protein-S-isoprenylcysteine O-methyltransferase Ste14